jgi:hypothetical protein
MNFSLSSTTRDWKQTTASHGRKDLNLAILGNKDVLLFQVAVDGSTSAWQS